MLSDIADAFAYTYRRGETLTNEQKATVFVNALRGFVKQVVRDWKITVAMEATKQATAPTAEPDLGTEGAV